MLQMYVAFYLYGVVEWVMHMLKWDGYNELSIESTQMD